MGLWDPVRGMEVYTFGELPELPSISSKVDPAIMLGGNSFKAGGKRYTYNVDGKLVTINRFKGILEKLRKIKY